MNYHRIIHQSKVIEVIIVYSPSVHFNFYMFINIAQYIHFCGICQSHLYFGQVTVYIVIVNDYTPTVSNIDFFL